MFSFRRGRLGLILGAVALVPMGRVAHVAGENLDAAPDTPNEPECWSTRRKDSFGDTVVITESFYADGDPRDSDR